MNRKPQRLTPEMAKIKRERSDVRTAFKQGVASKPLAHWAERLRNHPMRYGYRSWVACVLCFAYSTDQQAKDYGRPTAEFTELMDQCGNLRSLSEDLLYQYIFELGVPFARGLRLRRDKDWRWLA